MDKWSISLPGPACARVAGHSPFQEYDNPSMGIVGTACSATLLAFAAAVAAQEVQIIDLTAAPQNVALRYPPVVPLTTGNGIVSGGGLSSHGDCAPDIRDPHAAAAYL